VLPGLPSNEKNSYDHHNPFNKGPNLALFSFTESPSNSLSTIKFPKNHITSSYHGNLPKTTNAIFVHQRALGVNDSLATMIEEIQVIIQLPLLKIILKYTSFMYHCLLYLFFSSFFKCVFRFY
jgi:hypothetical protein